MPAANASLKPDTLELRMSTTLTWPVALPSEPTAAGHLDRHRLDTLDTRLLAVRLNGVETDDVVTALQGADRLALPADVWTQLHLRTPSGAPVTFEGRTYRELAQVAGLQWRIDEASQTLVIDAPPAAFAGARVAMDSAPAPTASAAPGGYANYELQWQRSTSAVGSGLGRDTTSALVEVGGFAAGGAGRATALLREGSGVAQRTRLETTWTQDVPSKTASLRLGDSIGRAGAWGRAVRFGGVQWGTDFSMQPGFLAFPLPTLRGEAALPSTVDVYVNNTLRLQSQVPAGPFDLTDVPIVTGQGQVRMVVRDLLGREQVVTRPYYVSPSLLREGLHAFSYEIGALREDFGIESNRYGQWVATATDKRGLSDRFTRELRGEFVGRQATLGATGIWLVPGVGVLNGTVAGSHGPDGTGAMGAVGSEYTGTNWSGNLQARYSGRDFRQLGQPNGPVNRNAGADSLPGLLTRSTPRFSTSASVGTSWRSTSLGTSWIDQRSWEGGRTRIASLNAGRDVAGIGTFGLFLLRDVSNRGTTVAVTFSRVLDGRTSANLGLTRNRDAQGGSTSQTLQLQRSAADTTGFSWQANVDRSDSNRANAQGVWQGEKVALSAGLARSHGSEDVRVGASGGVAVMGDSVFLSRRIDGAFAVVEVGDYADVQVLHDHRPVARTDSRGRALVTNLRGYEPNRIGVNAGDLPFDAEVDGLETVVVPPGRSGTSVRIPVTRTRAASFRLVSADGSAVPAGSLARVAGSTRSFPVGFDGKAYLSGLAAHSQVQVSWPGRECRASVELPAGGEELPELGTVRCL